MFKKIKQLFNKKHSLAVTKPAQSSNSHNSQPEEQGRTRQISFNVDNFTANEIERRVAYNYLNRNALFNIALFDYMHECMESDVQLGELEHWSDEPNVLKPKRYTIHLMPEVATVFESFVEQLKPNQTLNKSRIMRIAVVQRIIDLIMEEVHND